jgi:AI-2 transport protein TqsA
MDSATPAAGRAQTISLVIIATVMVGWVLHIGAAILQPLVIALLLANVLQPIVNALEKRRIPGPVAVVVLSAILFYTLFRVGVLVQESISAFIGEGTAIEEQVELPPEIGDDGEPVPVEEKRPPTTWNVIVSGLMAKMDRQGFSDEVKTAVRSTMNSIDVQGTLTDIIGSGISFTRSLVIILIYMAFFFVEQSIFRRKILAIAGTRRSEAVHALDTISRGVQRYLSVKTLVSLLTGTLSYFLLVFVDVPYPLVFALLTFLLNYIPTFGSILAGIFPTLTALAVNEQTWVPAVVVASGYITFNLVLGSIIEPRVLGRELNISPLVIIISVVVWAGIWGVMGAFLAVPLTSTIQIILANSGRGRPIAILLSGHPPVDEEDEARKASRLAPSKHH